MSLPPISFRQRILLVLMLLGAVPAALLGGGWAVTLLRINPARHSRAALEPVGTSGRELIRAFDTTRMGAAELRAFQARVQALEKQLTLSQIAVAALSLPLLYAGLLVARVSSEVRRPRTALAATSSSV